MSDATSLQRLQRVERPAAPSALSNALVFASNIMVDPGTMPGWLRAFVDVNPVSLMTTALRGLMSGDANLAEVGLALIAPVLLTVVLAPVTLWLYTRSER